MSILSILKKTTIKLTYHVYQKFRTAEIKVWSNKMKVWLVVKDAMFANKVKANIETEQKLAWFFSYAKSETFPLKSC